MASLKFHKVSSLPASCALGDVYYVVGKGIYVCTTAASSGATEAANYTRFSYANDASTSGKGVTSLSDAINSTSSTVAATSKAVKDAYDQGSKGVNDAANVQSSLNSHTGNKNNPHSVTASQVGLGKVTNDKQVKGLASGTTSGHFVTWGADGYTVADSGKNASSFDAAGTAATEAGKVLGTSSDGVDAKTVYGAIAKAAAAQSTANGKWSQKTATQASGGTAVEGTVKGLYADTSLTGYAKSPIISGEVWYRDTHNSHAHTFTVNTTTATDKTETSVAVVSALNNASATTGNLTSAYNRVSVPTLKVTNDLASRISANESAITNLQTVAATGMQYKGTISSISTTDAYVAGSVYRVSTAISIPAAQSATNAIIKAEVGDFIVCSTAGTGAAAKWDVWQANVNKDAYWDNNNPVSGNFVIADGTTGKIKDSGKSASSFDAAGTASDLVTTLRGGSNGTLKGAYDAAATAQATANGKWTKVVASTTAQGIMQVGTGLDVSSGTVSVKYGTTAGTACQGNDSRLSDARTPLAHNQASNTITAMTGYAKASESSAIDASKDSLNAAIGKLEYKVDTAQATANGKWTAVNATTSSKGIASFNSSNFDVTNGAVSLAWATWA